MKNMAVAEQTVRAVVYGCDEFTQCWLMFTEGGLENSVKIIYNISDRMLCKINTTPIKRPTANYCTVKHNLK